MARSTTVRGLALAAAALAVSSASAPASGATPTEIGTVRLASPGEGAPHAPRALLVAVRYPLHMKGRSADVRVELVSRGRVVRVVRNAARDRLAAGLPRDGADLRGSFRFVHRIALPTALANELLRRDGRLDVRVRAAAVLDLEGDGRAEARSAGRARRLVRPPRRTSAAVTCSSVPLVHARTRRQHAVETPQCSVPMRWSVASRPARGRLRRGPRWLVYRSDAGHRGWDAFVLRGRPRARAAAAQDGGDVLAPVHVQVGSGFPSTASVRAIGDSSTAGFGYFDSRAPMTASQLLSCRPGAQLNDACSSNSLNLTNSDGPVRYAPDYGLSNVIAWPARWAGWNGITNFANYAVSGSAPADWAPGGQFYAQTRAAELAAPDYLVTTVGANPLLSDVLFGIDNMKCALWSDLFGNYTNCVLAAFARAGLAANLRSLYADLLARTPAKTQILLMQYHLAIPGSALAYTALQLERMSELLNDQIATIAGSFGSSRLRVIAPPRFNVGIDMRPLYPATFSCSVFGYVVDGPSAQSTLTQDELLGDHLPSFCSGPPIGPPWIISADTGIHPSTAGHSYMANALPDP